MAGERSAPIIFNGFERPHNSNLKLQETGSPPLLAWFDLARVCQYALLSQETEHVQNQELDFIRAFLVNDILNRRATVPGYLHAEELAGNSLKLLIQNYSGTNDIVIGQESSVVRALRSIVRIVDDVIPLADPVQWVKGIIPPPSQAHPI